MQSHKIQQDSLLFDLTQLPKNLKLRNPVLYYLGNCLLALFAMFLIGFIICHYSVYEFCSWLKPGKFTLSFALYAYALGWFLYYLKETLSEKTCRLLTWAIVSVIILEMVVTLIQSTMTTPLYSSLEVPLPLTQFLLRGLYKLGNLFIIINASIALFIGAQFFKPLELSPPAYLWSIRASFIVFVLSCFLGLLLVIYYGQPIPDPNNLNMSFTQLSTLRSNLITMHFLGVHSLQLIPFMVYYLQKYLGKKFLISLTTAYSLGCFALFFNLTVG